MKKRFFAIISALITLSMIGSAFASCTGTNPTEDPADSSSESNENVGDLDNNDSSEGSEDDPIDGPLYDFENAATIEYANSILNGVNYYYDSAKRESAILENKEMVLEYGLLTDGNKKVTSLKNKNGVSYVENTMDVFVRMNGGNTYLASTTNAVTTSNLFRLGYYFYEARYEGQDFLNSVNIIDEKALDLSKGSSKNNSTESKFNENGELEVVITSTNDPYIVLADGSHRGDYHFLEITLKADPEIHYGQVYIITGSSDGYNSDQKYGFSIIADGEYHTYNIPLNLINGYNGKIRGIRFDLDGAVTNMNGASYTFKEIKLLTAENMDSLPAGLSIARSFNAYSDKLHHTLQVSASTETVNIAEIGMLTEIKENTVAKLIVKDKCEELHTSLDGVDWATVEYLAFDIKNAGIFGYILPYDGKGGSIKVTLSEGVYVIEQAGTPEGGKISPSEEGTNNANDFYLGQRIYTDDNHDFDEFLLEAFCERTPLAFGVTQHESRDASYVGYDSLRGLYVFNYSHRHSGVNDYPNVKFTVKGDDVDRKIYVMAASKDTTVVEWSAILNEKNFLLPIPMQVGKNFSEASGERNLYNIDDPVYSEAIAPLVIEKGSVYRYNIVNVYRNWGIFLVKQVSWIQFYAPYYHLSTGTTETNCIVPWYTTRTARSLSVLPDFRAMSAPPFSGVQRNSGGTHIFLRYTDADGNFVASENVKNVIGSYGPTYADVTMDFISDDGKIKITYNHMEMPQEDENRTYYEMNYEILEDVSFKDFAKDFSFYSVSSNDPKGVYTLLGYLDENNESQVVDAKMAGDEAVYYKLGQNAPYFSYMKMTDDRANKSGYVNLAFLVHSSEFIIGGEKVTPNFILTDLGGTLSISLDYGEITLKKGDKITINCILMPWGSQETVYDESNGKAPDQNVRDVRQNSIFDPLKAEAVADCEVIDTVYVPMLRTTNGKSAEFTLSGGHENCAVRIYGFDLMTAPEIYELVNGNWIPYKTASVYYSYNHDITQVYDGYGISYDGDGTFSYSFIAKMDNGAARTFKIVADKEFRNWPEISKSDVICNYIDPASKYQAAGNAFVFHVDFIGGVKNAYNSTSSSGVAEVDYTGADLSTTGNKLTVSGWAMVEGGVEKYLWSIDGKDWYDCSHSGGSKPGNCGQSVINAVASINVGYTFTESDAIGGNISGGGVLVIDLSQYKGETVDVYIAGMPKGSTDAICVFTSINGVTVSENGGNGSEDNNNTPTEYPDLDPESTYSLADKFFCFHVDKINGKANSFNSISNKGIVKKDLNETLTGTNLTIMGWSPMEGGAEKYMWSVDGKNWYECQGSTSQSGATILGAASGEMSGAYTFTEADGVKGQYNLTIDLSAFKGQTVNVRIAAIPKGSTDTICILTVLNGITVPGDNGSNDNGNTSASKYFCFHVDKINGVTNTYNSVSNKGITEKNLNETISGTDLTLVGWCPVEGGIEKYVWSVDGKNWFECTATTSQSNSTVLNAATGQMGGAYTFTEADGVKGQYNLTIDLSAYAGQTVNVKIGAILTDGDSTNVCVFTSINGVTVAAN